jgi:hypothetical protein
MRRILPLLAVLCMAYAPARQKSTAKLLQNQARKLHGVTTN